ncbi:MAG: hypothetical protein M1549_03340 [Candidatus Dependentiae bacterium]|nr:hypothetical protein [Candidatus Dependentiae bacterium]
MKANRILFLAFLLTTAGGAEANGVLKAAFDNIGIPSRITQLWQYGTGLTNNFLAWGLQKGETLAKQAQTWIRTMQLGSSLPLRMRCFLNNPKLATSLLYQKIRTHHQRNENKKRLRIGALAPQNVGKICSALLRELQSGNTELRETRETTLDNGHFTIKFSVLKEGTTSEGDDFRCNLTLSEGSCQRADAEFCVVSRPITNQAGQQSEEIILPASSIFSVSLEWRQQGLGRYLLEVLWTTLRELKNATWFIRPGPYELAKKQEWGYMLSILKAYYAKFGFVQHPTDKEIFFVSFRDGKVARETDFLNALNRGDHRTIKKLFTQGIDLETSFDDTPLKITALTCAFNKKDNALFASILSQTKLGGKTVAAAHELLDKCLACQAFTMAGLILKNEPTLINSYDGSQTTLLYRAVRGDYGTCLSDNPTMATSRAIEFLLAYRPDPYLGNCGRPEETVQNIARQQDQEIQQIINGYTKLYRRKE